MDITRRAFSQGLCSWPLVALAAERNEEPWWKTAVLYQIYPRSFQDSNGDGIGDFPGMISRIDHLRDLGVDAVWITACFDSPNADNGYDVRDYRKIHPDFGSMDDFERFMDAAGKRGIRVILDMVFNHSSDEHRWFRESRKSRNNPYRDYYFWRDPVSGGPPTNWPCVYGGPGWELDKTTGQYYLHHYAIKQPDLNWENPKVRHELYDVLNFWAAKGVAGYRFDCVGEISKPLPMRDMTPQELKSDGMALRTSGPRLNEYLKEMRAATSRYPGLYFLGEGWGMSRESIIEATDERNHELNSAFRFEFQLHDSQDWRKLPWSLEKLKEFNRDNQFSDNPHVWPVTFLEDHDFARSVSRFGSAKLEFRDRSAKLLATMFLSLKGTPLVYQGEEIGMTDYPFRSVDQYDDIGVKNLWKDLVLTGKVSAKEYLDNNAANSRDNSRTPMQWDATRNAGFSTSAKPWLAVNPNYTKINVAAENADSNSVLAFYRRMIRLRKSMPVLVSGSYRDLSSDPPRVYAYVRGEGAGQAVVVLNFSDEPADFRLPASVVLRKRVISNVADGAGGSGSTVHLQPWEAGIYE